MNTFVEHVPRQRDGTYVCCGGYGEHFETCYVGMLVAENRQLRDSIEQLVMATPSSILAAVFAERLHEFVPGSPAVAATRVLPCGICDARDRAGDQSGPPHGPCRDHSKFHCTAGGCW
jgi:hypothetical protein